jgi:hypothetical protein
VQLDMSLSANSGHWQGGLQPRERLLKRQALRIAADYDWMAMRAAALELQQADELARSFAKSNTNRLIGSAADLIRSRDTSRSSP